MLDMKWIRQHSKAVQEAADRKGIAFSVEELLQADENRRRLLTRTEEGRQARNRLSQDIGRLLQEGRQGEANAAKAQVKEWNLRLSLLEEQLQQAEAATRELLLRAPNITAPDTPAGASDADNVAVRHVGSLPEWAFPPRDHMALAELHRLANVPRGVKTGGARSYYLTGAGVALHRAVQQLAMDMLEERGFQWMEVPLLVRGEALVNTGFFPLGRDQVYQVEGADSYLVGTSEAPLVSYYAGEIVDVSRPIRLAASSVCFRSEVGAAGRDVRGLYRVHQFSKVEQVVLCRDEAQESEGLLQEITANAEELLRRLELPYRVMAVCAGDMSQKTYKQYDIETWMPSREAYGETHSSSNLHDFQARRANIRYRDSDGRLRYCHTLNNTMVATPRILIPLLENHQEEDGAIRIPAALQPYLNGLAKLVPQGLQP
ncbi:serine--tRNA ligase [Paenibacillus sp. YN15]|uniref:serine--tRNA ligase n=1 Tax=Paenibacillus sp. YN15 TaxID=1742774 RepID=UPI000DCC5D17|nr:serine--tRNA ligase [Paenibacillus sp. YN15]RAV04088.1 serine--tRNA ligase [Paenibacillus sp. YN15]